MELESIFEDSKEWIKNNSKDLILGVVSTKNSITISYDSEESTLEDFLEIGRKNGTKIFIVTKFKFTKDEIINDIILDDLPKSNRKRIEKQIGILDKYDGKIELLIYSYLLDSVIYEYGIECDFTDLISEAKGIILENSEDDFERQIRINRERALPVKQINELGLSLAKTEDFFKRRFLPDRLMDLLLTIIEEKGLDEDEIGSFDKSRIITKARSIFQRKFLKQKEKEIINQIAKLKEEGLSKIAIRSKLDLTQGVIDKYYYK